MAKKKTGGSKSQVSSKTSQATKDKSKNAVNDSEAIKAANAVINLLSVDSEISRRYCLSKHQKRIDSEVSEKIKEEIKYKCKDTMRFVNATASVIGCSVNAYIKHIIKCEITTVVELKQSTYDEVINRTIAYIVDWKEAQRINLPLVYKEKMEKEVTSQKAPEPVKNNTQNEQKTEQSKQQKPSKNQTDLFS